MDALHAALRSLGQIDFDRDLAGKDGEDLRTFTRDLLIQSNRVIESVPLPPPSQASGSSNGNGSGNGNGNGIETTPGTISSETEEAQRQWSGPVNKVDNEKENPLRIPVYKLAGQDGHGAWFGRRSIHYGLSFDALKEKMQSEFDETKRIREANGGRLEGGSIRGIGCERCVESIDVLIPDENQCDDREEGPEEKTVDGDDNGSAAEELGSIGVYLVSAGFTKPSTPRDFVTMLLTSDKALDCARSTDEQETGSRVSASRGPKSYTIVSKPCTHSAAPPRKGFIRGQYESIECIREMEPDNITDGSRRSEPRENGVDSDANIKPVEWIMITRSDPGGSIPRWLVERGTIPSIVDDARKFMNWARHEQQPNSTGDREKASHDNVHETQSVQHSESFPDSFQVENLEGEMWNPATAGSHVASIIDGVVGLLLLSLKVVTPQMLHKYFSAITMPVGDGSLYTKGLKVGSTPRDESASNHESLQTNDCPEDAGPPSGNDPRTLPESNQVNRNRQGTTGSEASASSSVNTGKSSSQVAPTAEKVPSKEVAKLAERRRKVEEELNELRSERLTLRQEVANPAGSAGYASDTGTQPSTSSSRESGDTNGDIAAGHVPSKAQRAALKRLPAIDRRETKLMSQIRNIESQEQKAAAHAEAKQQKEEQKRRRKNAETEIEALREETRRLADEVRNSKEEAQRWKDLVGQLQSENTRIVAESHREKGQ